MCNCPTLFQALHKLCPSDWTFNIGGSFQMLRECLDDRTRYIYQQIYGNDSQEVLRAASECVVECWEMTDDVAHYKVDARHFAVILCRDMGGENSMEITLLLPRRTPEGFHFVSSRCLIVTGGRWSAGDWSLPGHNDKVPLVGLSIVHPWWREYRALGWECALRHPV